MKIVQDTTHRAYYLPTALPVKEGCRRGGELRGCELCGLIFVTCEDPSYHHGF
jgi:hypothetical protein